MKTKDVGLDTKLNMYLWSKGVRNAPFRVRARQAGTQAQRGQGGGREGQSAWEHRSGRQPKTNRKRPSWWGSGRPRVRDRALGSRGGSSCEKPCPPIKPPPHTTTADAADAVRRAHAT